MRPWLPDCHHVRFRCLHAANYLSSDDSRRVLARSFFRTDVPALPVGFQSSLLHFDAPRFAPAQQALRSGASIFCSAILMISSFLLGAPSCEFSQRPFVPHAG
jgi:hypothetical protein